MELGDNMEKLTDLPNIGEEIERQLNCVGIFNLEELKAKGSKQVWLDIQKMDPSACLNRLYALEGAIQNIRWKNLPFEIKCELKYFYNSNKKNN